MRSTDSVIGLQALSFETELDNGSLPDLREFDRGDMTGRDKFQGRPSQMNASVAVRGATSLAGRRPPVSAGARRARACPTKSGPRMARANGPPDACAGGPPRGWGNTDVSTSSRRNPALAQVSA